VGNDDKLEISLCPASLNDRVQRLGQRFNGVSIEICRRLIKSNELQGILVNYEVVEKG
jgi:hypothetical protein